MIEPVYIDVAEAAGRIREYLPETPFQKFPRCPKNSPAAIC